MAHLLIIGAGGVGSVVTQKCARMRDVFDTVVLASRTLEKCEKIAATADRPVAVEQVDADHADAVATLIDKHQSDLVINVALPYQDLSIMEGCLKAGAHYLDTANYEPPDEAKFCYKWQWAYHERFEKAGLMALLGCGFDPGATNVFTAYLRKHHFDRIETVDILDCNAGEHGHPFATNFNPEINIREITAPGRYREDGEWITTAPLAVHRPFDFPRIGEREMYLMYHEEMESLTRHFPEIRRMRFLMTFSQEYLTHLRVLQNVGMTRIDPVPFRGHDIVPLQFLKALLPDPATLGETYRGKTNIGVLARGTKEGQDRAVYVYNVCEHQHAYKDTRSQAVSYTTGVPAAIGAELMVRGIWRGMGVFNVEQMDPDPFMERMGPMGLPVEVAIPDKDLLAQ
ncbi:MAG: saccharopine dehydrogenase family protein [Deltaproteobacteria bacterium]|nr:saccharopine dehydrogenase family protein [Deltaproteobacteria bacterium]